MRAAETLDATFAALADATRRAMLMRLAHGEATVNELARPFGLALPTISKHLRVLERARLIEKRKQASRRLCRLRTPSLKEASEWIEKYTLFWESTLDSLAGFADHGEAQPPERSRRAGKHR